MSITTYARRNAKPTTSSTILSEEQALRRLAKIDTQFERGLLTRDEWGNERLDVLDRTVPTLAVLGWIAKIGV